MVTLGEFIRDCRDKLDYSLREFAKLIGISAPFLSDIELGRRYPSDEVLKRIATELKVEFEELKELDHRVNLKEIKNLLDSDSKYGFAFRNVAKKKISSDKLLEWTQKKENNEK